MSNVRFAIVTPIPGRLITRLGGWQRALLLNLVREVVPASHGSPYLVPGQQPQLFETLIPQLRLMLSPKTICQDYP